MIRNNRPAGVFMSEEEYGHLLAAARGSARPRSGASAWDLVLDRPYQGSRTKEEIDAQVHEERARWGER